MAAGLTGGDKLRAKLAEIAKQIEGKHELRVGFLEGATYPDEAGTPVAEISLCFMCQMMVAAPTIPKAKRIGGDDTYGLNEKSTAQLRALCRELGLPMCDAKNPTEFGGPK